MADVQDLSGEKDKDDSRAEAAREEILRHAEALFGHYGYAKTNIGEIAERCGMSPGNLYRYFRNKQAIGEEVVRRYMAQSEAAVSDELTRPADSAEERLRAMFRVSIAGMIHELRQNPKIVELADMICSGNSGILARHVEWRRAQVEMLIREGVAAGDFTVDDIPRAALGFLDAFRGFLAPPMLAMLDLDAAPARMEAMMDLLFSGMRA